MNVISTHLHWSPKRENVKYFQMVWLINYVTQNYTHDDNVVLLGDFNCIPNQHSFSIFDGIEPTSESISIERSNDCIYQDTKNLYDTFKYDDYLKFGLLNAYSGYQEIISNSESLEENYSVTNLDGYPQFSNFVHGFKAMIDHIFYSSKTLSLTGIKKMPTQSDLEGYIGFPCDHYPSDHLSIGVELTYQT